MSPANSWALEEITMDGKVKFFNRRKGFGFIQGNDGNDYFVHISQLQGAEYLDDDQEVTFEPGQGEKGLAAQQVKAKGAGSDSGSAPAPAQETESAEAAPAEEVEKPEATEDF